MREVVMQSGAHAAHSSEPMPRIVPNPDHCSPIALVEAQLRAILNQIVKYLGGTSRMKRHRHPAEPLGAKTLERTRARSRPVPRGCYVGYAEEIVNCAHVLSPCAAPNAKKSSNLIEASTGKQVRAKAENKSAVTAVSIVRAPIDTIAGWIRQKLKRQVKKGLGPNPRC